MMPSHRGRPCRSRRLQHHAVGGQPVQDLQLDSRVSRTQFQYTLEDADLDELRTFTPKMLQKLRTLPELLDVASDFQDGGIQLDLTIDRDTASRLGVSPQAIDDVLYDTFGQRQISTIFTQLNQYRVILEVKPDLARNADTLRSLYVRSASGDPVPLSMLVKQTQQNAALAEQSSAAAVSLRQQAEGLTQAIAVFKADGALA